MSTPGGTVVIHAQTSDGGTWLATHPRAGLKGSWVVEPTHYDGLPDGHTRTTTLEVNAETTSATSTPGPGPLAALLAANHAAATTVATRPLADYAAAAAAAPHGGRS